MINILTPAVILQMREQAVLFRKTAEQSNVVLAARTALFEQVAQKTLNNMTLEEKQSIPEYVTYCEQRDKLNDLLRSVESFAEQAAQVGL